MQLSIMAYSLIRYGIQVSRMYKDTFREIQNTLNTDQTYIMQLIVRTFIENQCVNSGYE